MCTQAERRATLAAITEYLDRAEWGLPGPADDLGMQGAARIMRKLLSVAVSADQLVAAWGAEASLVPAMARLVAELEAMTRP